MSINIHRLILHIILYVGGLWAGAGLRLWLQTE